MGETEGDADRLTPPATRWVFSFLRPHGLRLAGVLVLSLLATAMALAQPYITKLLIDDGLLARRFDLVVLLCAAMIGLAAAGAVIGGLNRWHYVTLSGRVLFSLREALYRHLQRLSPAYFARASGGDLMARLDGDIGEIQRFAVDSPLALVNGVLALGGSLGLMLWLEWRLALIAFVLLPVEVAFLRYMRPRVEARTRALRERASGITGFLFDTLSAMKLVQSVAAEPREAERLSTLNRHYLGDLLRLQMTNFVTATIPNLLTNASTALVFIIGGYWTIRGELTLGTLIAFTAYLTRAVGPVQTLLGLYVALMRARVSLARVQEITRVEPAVVPPASPKTLGADARGEIRFEGVSFGYPRDEGESPYVLRDAHLIIPAGRAVGIIGASGIGKTTLIDLLHRHYDPESGRILLDGVDLRDLDLGILRRRVAVVAQDTALLPGTIFENIRYARPDATDAEVREAARRAEVEAFVEKLPDGYETEVGARGAALSGGQRQRIAVARAILQDPLVLVLDEATSGVDTNAEARMLGAIHELFAERTRLIVSHRAGTLVGIDMLCELSDGGIRVLEGVAPE